MAIGADRLDLEQLAGFAGGKAICLARDAAEDRDLGARDGVVERPASGGIGIVEVGGADVAAAWCGGLALLIRDDLVVVVDGVVSGSRENLEDASGFAAPDGGIRLAVC